MTWSPFLTEVTPAPMSTTMPAPSCPRIAGNRPSGSAPERVNSSVWQMPVALVSTRTSPALGPSSVTVVTSSGFPASNATAARTSIDISPGPLLGTRVVTATQGIKFRIAALHPGYRDGKVKSRASQAGGMRTQNAWFRFVGSAGAKPPRGRRGRRRARLAPRPQAKASCRMSALRLRHDPDVGLGRLPALGILLLGIIVADRAGDDHVLAALPVHRGRHLVLGGELQRVDDAQHLVEVAAGGHGIDQDELDLLVRADDEDVAHGLIVGGRAFCRVSQHRGRQHPVELRHVEVDVGDHRIVRREALRLLDVARPARMLVDRVDRQAYDLDAALVELRLDLGHVAELGGADGGEILWMREQHSPFVADPIVKTDLAFGGFRFEIRRSIVDRESHVHLRPWQPIIWAQYIVRCRFNSQGLRDSPRL